MGQKVHPEAMRVGYIHDWKSNWFSEKNFSDFLIEDVRIRDHITGKLAHAGLSDITIRKDAAEVEVNIHTARPGIVIGKKGADIDKIRAKVKSFTDSEVHINIVEVRKPETDANLVAQGIAQQLERRVAFRRAMKRAVQTAIRMGAGGIRVNVGGRLGGADIARTEWYREGRVPLHTLRADIDYGTAEAETTYGIIGVKVWIFKGEVLEHDPMAHERRATEGGDGAGQGAPRRERTDREDGERRPRGRNRGGDTDGPSAN